MTLDSVITYSVRTQIPLQESRFIFAASPSWLAVFTGAGQKRVGLNTRLLFPLTLFVTPQKYLLLFPGSLELSRTGGSALEATSGVSYENLVECYDADTREGTQALSYTPLGYAVAPE